MAKRNREYVDWRTDCLSFMANERIPGGGFV